MPPFFRAGLGKGEVSEWKINISLSWTFFFFSFESKNISWFFVIRNMLGVFLDNSRSNTIFSMKGMQGPFARRVKALLKNKIKPPVKKKKKIHLALDLNKLPGKRGQQEGRIPVFLCQAVLLEWWWWWGGQCPRQAA